MALNFPATPTLNQLYTSGTKTWKWDGTSWISATSTGSLPEGGTSEQVLTKASSNNFDTYWDTPVGNKTIFLLMGA